MTAAGYWFELRIKSVWREQAILEAAAANRTAATNGAEAKIGAFYRAYMNEALAESLGVKPLLPALTRIGTARTRRELATLMGSIAGPATVRAINTIAPVPGRLTQALVDRGYGPGVAGCRRCRSHVVVRGTPSISDEGRGFHTSARGRALFVHH